MAIPGNVQNAIDNGYEFRFGDYINKSFAIVQKNLGQFIVGALVAGIILFGTSLVTGAVGAMLTIFGGVIGVVLNQVISQVVQSAVFGPLLSGMYNVAQKTDTNKPVEFGDFFSGFNKWAPLFTTTIMSSLIVLASCVPGIYLMIQGGFNFAALNTPAAAESFEDLDFGNIGLGAFVVLIPAIYFTVSYIWAPLLTWFYNISGWEALEASRKLVAKNFFPVFGFVLVMGFIFLVGFVLLCVGALFTLPVMMVGIYASFADVVGLNRNPGSADEVLDHFAPKM